MPECVLPYFVRLRDVLFVLCRVVSVGCDDGDPKTFCVFLDQFYFLKASIESHNAASVLHQCRNMSGFSARARAHVQDVLSRLGVEDVGRYSGW